MAKVKQSIFLSDKENKAIDLVAQAKKSIKDAREDSQLSLSIYQTMLSQVKQLTGRKQVTYKSIFTLDDRKLSFLINTLERFLERPQATRQGREEIWEKSKKSFLSNHSAWNAQEANRLYDFYATDIYHTLLEAGYISSDDMIELSLSDRNDSDIEQALVAIKGSKKELKKLSKKKTGSERVSFILDFLDTNIAKE